MLFSIYIVQIAYLSFELECEMMENKQKEAEIGPFKKTLILWSGGSCWNFEIEEKYIRSCQNAAKRIYSLGENLMEKE